MIESIEIIGATSGHNYFEVGKKSSKGVVEEIKRMSYDGGEYFEIYNTKGELMFEISNCSCILGFKVGKND